MQYFLGKSGKFFKANLHSHSTVSDGELSPEEVKKVYKSNSYQIVAYTDHEVLVPHKELNDDDFLAITAVEIDCTEPGVKFPRAKTHHLNLLSKDPDKTIFGCFNLSHVWQPHSLAYVSEEQKKINFPFSYSTEVLNKAIKLANDEGFLVTYNHPYWSLQNLDGYSGFEGLWGMEVYNSISDFFGTPEDDRPFDDMLKLGKKLFPVCADDSHKREHCCRAFTMVECQKLDYGEVMTALEKGDCYSSFGPTISEFSFDKGKFFVKCSNAQRIELLTDRRYGLRVLKEKKPINEAIFDMENFIRQNKDDEKTAYVRLVVTDEKGKKAYSRPVYLDELKNF